MNERTDRELSAARRLARREAEMQWLRNAYATLRNQELVLGAIQQAQQVLWGKDGFDASNSEGLAEVVAKLMLDTCEAIVDRAGVFVSTAQPERDQAEGKSGEAREESLPW